MRLAWIALLPVVFAAAACSSSDGTFDPGDDDMGLPAEVPDAGPQPLPDLGDQSGEPSDAGAQDPHDAGSPKSDGGATCAIASPPHAAYLKYGLHPDASDALVSIGVTAGRILQTIGDAAASAGTHAQDGVAGGYPYSAATDFSVSGMTDAQVSAFLDMLTSVGFAPYYRKPGYDGWPSTEVRHIHAIWVGAKMKLSLRDQMRDWHVGKNGLASHTTYTFKTWSSCWRDAIWARYLTENSATN